MTDRLDTTDGSSRDAAPAWPVVFGVLSIALAAACLARTNSYTTDSAWHYVRRLLNEGKPPNLPVSLGLFTIRSVSWLTLIAGGVLLLCRKRRAGQALHLLGAAALLAMVCMPGAAYAVRPGLPAYPSVIPPYNDFQKVAMILIDLVYPAVVLAWLAGRRLRPRPDPPARRPIWPTVLGALAMAWAGGEFLRLAALVIGWVFLPPFLPAPATMASLALIGWHVLAAMAWLGACVSGWLLLRRRGAGASGLVACGTALLLLSLLLPCQQWMLWRMRGALRGAMWPHLVASLALPAVGRLIFPSAVLIWMARRTIRDQVRSWGRDGADKDLQGRADGLRSAVAE
ncbi:MAG TPA: hypothetical protein VFJ30_11255 [Phycisphaerae bacterium]|nr:hypothetical protein [Phycisphaerae bacterium]